jgi:hypothetical protein
VQFGVLLADGNRGPFRFELQYIKALLRVSEDNLVKLPHTSRPSPVLLPDLEHDMELPPAPQSPEDVEGDNHGLQAEGSGGNQEK